MTESGFESRDDPNGCVRCGTTLTSHGVQEFRTGGTVGATSFFLGEWGELGEDKLPLLVLSCPRCTRVEFRRPAF